MTESENQDPVLALLADPATHHGAAVERIDTHAASVFLAGDRAFKVKRAVRFPFLDFSTAAKRKAACEAELAINRSFAREIYRRVVPITRAPDGRLELDGAGTPVEWAVEMHRFDETSTLDRLADAGKIDAALADALGRAAATIHAAAPLAEPGAWIEALAVYVEQNNAALREMPALFPGAEVEALGVASRAPLVASGDVLYDLAFLLMDLAERGLRAHANTVLNRYLVETRRPEDIDALACLPLFLSVRAAIRAKVTAARRRDADAQARPAIERSARKYFDCACRLVEPPPPVLVAVGGLSGTGKSALARALAPALGPPPGAVVLRSDVERKALLGADEHERLPNEAYAPAVTARVYAAVAEKARRAIAAGHAAVVDAVFAKAEERAAMKQAADGLGVPFHGLFLEVDLARRIARLGARSGDASDADAAVARAQESYDLGALDWTRIDASGTPEDTLDRARAAIHP